MPWAAMRGISHVAVLPYWSSGSLEHVQLTLSGSLQLSFQPRTASAEHIATGPGSKALTVQHQGCPAPSMGAFLSGDLISCVR